MSVEDNLPKEVRRQKPEHEFEEPVFDPRTASDREVIAHFLKRTIGLRDSDNSSRYAATVLSVSDAHTMSEFDEIIHTRLRQIIKESDMSDEKWEDEDDVAGEIYRQLRLTKGRSNEFVDQRKALQRLLLLRGAEVKLDTAEEDQTQHWEALLRKIGSKALK